VLAAGGPAPGSAGFGRSVSVCPPLLSGSVAVPCALPIYEPLPGSFGCNSADAPAGDESAARIPSADNAACAAAEATAFADPLDFPADL